MPRFGDGTPRWVIDGGFCERLRLPTGTVLTVKYTRTGNALIRRRALMQLEGPFNEHFNHTGGEDTDVFARMMETGCRFVAVDTAVVYEHVTLARTRLLWMLRRRFKGSMDAARLDRAELSPEQRRWRSRRALMTGLRHAVIGLLLFPIFRIRGFRHLQLAVRHLGQFGFLSGLPPSRMYLEDSWR
jgi:hypothetical protein